MAALKAVADKEQSAFEEEWKKLGAMIDDDRRMRELQRQREMDERDRKTQQVCISADSSVSSPRKLLIFIIINNWEPRLMMIGTCKSYSVSRRWMNGTAKRSILVFQPIHRSAHPEHCLVLLS